MLKNHKLAKAIADAGWSQFVRQLEYKAAWYGRTLVRIDRWYPSSKMCHDCGFVLAELDLEVRKWTCPACGVWHDRDVNAAQSIGIPDTTLQPIILQESLISNTSAPITIFSNQPATDYYSNVAQRYQLLAVQVRGMETQITQQFDYQAALDIQNLENALAERQ